MAVKLRLARHGSKKHPYYRLVAADARARRDGRFLEHVGSYDPNLDPPGVRLQRDRIRHWLEIGAKPSPTVARLLARYLDGEDTVVPIVRKRASTPPEAAAAPESTPPEAAAAPEPAAPEAAAAPESTPPEAAAAPESTAEPAAAEPTQKTEV